MKLKAPFPWFGGKSRVAHLVWERFGDVGNYVEPFAGSLAVLLARPTPAKVETVNDLDCYLANFWRATQAAPVEVARFADAPVNEADLHARHRWLHKQAEPALSPAEAQALEAFRAAHPALAARVLHDPARWGFREKMRNDPAFFDAQLAGWWVWGLSCWIGDNWCRPTEQNSPPYMRHVGQGVNMGRFEEIEEETPSLGGNDSRVHRGRGVHKVSADRCTHKVMLAGNGHGAGVHSGRVEATPMQVPMLRGGKGSPAHGNGVHQFNAGLLAWFEALGARLRRVRVCCGDWARVLKPSVTVGHGLTGVFLDPPYGVEDRAKVYNHDSLSLAGDVRAWCAAHGDDPKLRIALCGYEGEHNELEALGWDVQAWKAMGGYGNQSGGKNDNAKRERIWFSPHCLRAGLF